MQAPTHILAGALIQKGFSSLRHRSLVLALSATCAFLSHGILDRLANLTYHRANPDWHSPIWVGYHAALIVVTILFVYWWWTPFKWGIIFACLPDIDWVFIHAQEIFHFQLSFYHRPILHNLLGHILDTLPGLNWLHHLPNFRSNPWAILPEVLLMTLIAIVLRRNRASAATLPTEPRP